MGFQNVLWPSLNLQRAILTFQISKSACSSSYYYNSNHIQWIYVSIENLDAHTYEAVIAQIIVKKFSNPFLKKSMLDSVIVLLD